MTTLKKVRQTRWSSLHDAIKSLRHNYSDIMKTLNKINLTSSKADERAEAAGLFNAIQKFEFSIQIVLQDKLLSSIDAVSQYMQKESMSLFEASFLLEAALTAVKQQRTEFDEI